MTASVTAGCIKGPGLDTHLLPRLTLAGMPYDVASAIARALGDAWANWIQNLKMDLPGALPVTYLAFPGSTTGVDPVIGIFPLSLSRSIGEPSLQAESLRQALAAALSGFIEEIGRGSSYTSPVLQQTGSAQQLMARIAFTSPIQNGAVNGISQSVSLNTRVNQGDASGAIAELANWIAAGFRDWKKNAKLGQVFGQGTKTTFAPPVVPLGTVTAGILSGTPALRESAVFGS
jgi:hypothetical protein